jgi:hypothetical protein
MATESTEEHGKIKAKTQKSMKCEKPVMATESHGNTRKKIL